MPYQWTPPVAKYDAYRGEVYYLPAQNNYVSVPVGGLFNNINWHELFTCRCINPKEVASLIGKIVLISFPFWVAAGQASLLNNHVKTEAEKIVVYILGLTINSVYLATSCFFHCRTYGCANYCQEGAVLRTMTISGIFGVIFSAVFTPGIASDDS